MSDKRDKQISKALSYLLRHGAEKEKLSIDSNGFVQISNILQNNRLKTHKTTIEDIERIVNNNDKKRFTLKNINGITFICANQGHSLKKINQDDEVLQLITNDLFPEVLIHGTTHNKLKQILESDGLNKMNRNHIHFTSLLKNENENVSGLRLFSTVLIYLDIDKLKKNQDKIKFYKSLNNVYLTSGNDEGYLRKEYFAKIIDRKTGEEIPFV
ncbi:hypothetical protein WICMUC_001275 [Wickerhamomyces mucosus]|uniref:2'-phosphotransferase n=1 Tax=Wickerhamomyces mucosus TaxID=1378264 RepID=A0A9P8PXK4_9ASCO|nr:hypothetical protein WICMUC_001275 [Wickerhamomyces mucosus]